MSTNVGSIHYDLSLNTKDFDKSQARITEKLASMSKNLLAFAAKATAAFGAAGVAASGFALKSAASFEQTRVGLENMLGSADEARKMLSRVSKFAAETPFEFPELADTVKQLIAFGFSGDDAFKTMQNLGDVSAAVNAPIGELAYLMGTLKTQGRAMTIDIRQFAQRGIPIYEYLTKVVGKSGEALKAMIEEGKIGFPEVEKAFTLMTAEGGKFHATMEKQSQTLTGRMSTLKDTIMQTARELVGISETGDIIQGSLFDKLTNGIQMLIDKMPTWIKTLEGIKQSITDNFLTPLINNVKNMSDGFIEFATRAMAVITPVLGLLYKVIEESLIPALQRLWKEAIEPLVPLVGTSIVLVFSAWVLQLTIAIKVISWLIEWLTNLINYFKQVGLAAADMAKEIWSKITSAFDKVVQWINTVINWFRNLNPEIKSALSTVFQTIIGPFGSAFDWIANKVSWLLDRLGLLDRKASSTQDKFRGIQIGGITSSGVVNQGFARGGYTGPGDANEIAGLVHKGEYVLPKEMVNQNTGTPNLAGGTHIYGNINIGSQSDADYFFSKLSRNQELSMRGLSTMAGTVG